VFVGILLPAPQKRAFFGVPCMNNMDAEKWFFGKIQKKSWEGS